MMKFHRFTVIYFNIFTLICRCLRLEKYDMLKAIREKRSSKKEKQKMGPKTKVFDIWGNTAPKMQYAFAGYAPAPKLDHSAAKAKAAKAKRGNQKEELPVFSPDKERLEVWKDAVVRSRSERMPPGNPIDQEPDGPKPFWRQKYLVGASALAVLLLGGVATFLFGLHGSLAPTYLGNIKVDSAASPSLLQAKIDGATQNYNLSIEDTNGKIGKYPLKQTGIIINSQKSADNFKSTLNRNWLARLEWWQPIKVGLTTRVDQDVFQQFLNEAVVKANQPYQNATLAIDGGKVTITPDAAGKGRTLKYPSLTLPTVVANLDTKPVKLQLLPIPAPIAASDLSGQKTKLEAILNQKITLTIADVTIAPSPADIAGWLDLSPVEHSKTIDITVNSGRVQSYLDKIAKPYVQPPRSRLVMTQSDGSVTVLDPGANGIDIVNKDKTASDIASLVLAAKGLTQQLDISYASAKTVEVQPYDKWIVVDVTTKRMYAYEQKNLVKSFLVSAGAPKTPTVLGQYAIYSKYDSQDMRGSNADGSRYFQPAVPWVNYFYKDYAIHGNYWRPLSYFGNINSSHGCVGVVDDEAKWIYDWAPIGTPVIVHA